MTTIGNVIYGIRLTDEIRRAVSNLMAELEISPSDPESYGFTELYSGNAPEVPGYCGVLIKVINECEDVRVGDLPNGCHGSVEDQILRCLRRDA